MGKKKDTPPPSDRIEPIAALLHEAETMVSRALEVTYLMGVLHGDGRLSRAERTDLGFLARECGEFFDKAKKECFKLQDAVSLSLGREVMGEFQNQGVEGSNDDPSATLAGHYATGSIDVKVVPLTPSRKDPIFKQGLLDIGIPKALVESDAVELRWSGLVDYIKEQAAQGKPTPRSLRHEATPYVVFRRRKQQL